MNNRRITISFTDEEYLGLKNLADKNNISFAEQVRLFTKQGLDGQLTENNIDFLAPIIRQQLSSIITPQLNKLIKLSSKTYIESFTSSLLNAETINKFVSLDQQEEFFNVYEKARKKAVASIKIED